MEQWDVHIISISFGFEEENQLIDAAVERAIGKGKLVFAAASNNGGLYGRSRPARQDGVMCIHACDGLCNIGDMNPSPLDYKSNFATLGVAVPSRWKNKDVWKTGTSFATPIAAGFAADILEFANKKCNLTPERRKILHKYRGMEAVFRKMSEKRKEFNIVHPKYLWDYDMNEHEVARVIEKIVQGV